MLSSLPSCLMGPDSLMYSMDLKRWWVSLSLSYYVHRPILNHFLTMCQTPCIGPSQPVRQDYSHFTDGKMEFRQVLCWSRHTPSKCWSWMRAMSAWGLSQAYEPYHNLNCPGLACWRDTWHARLRMPIHLFPLREGKGHFPSINLPLSWAPGRPCFLPFQGVVPSLAEICFLSLCCSVTPNLAFRYGVRSHTPACVGQLLSYCKCSQHNITGPPNPLPQIVLTCFCNYLVNVCFPS